MAISSITKNFVISGKAQVEMFVNTIEESAQKRSVHTPVATSEITDETELLEFIRIRKNTNGRKNKYRIINNRRYIGSEHPELGEDEFLQILSGFSCPMNPDVERFLKHSSIEFTKKNQSVTYLVFSVVGGNF